MADSNGLINNSETEFDPELDIKIEEEFIDDGEILDDNDPDWREDFASASNRMRQENASSSSEFEITGPKRKYYLTQDLKTAVKAVHNKSLTLSSASQNYNVPITTLRKHVKKYAKEQELSDKAKCPKGRKPKARKKASTLLPDIEKNKRLCVLIEDSEKADVDEIAALSDIYSSIEKAMEKQEKVLELVENFVVKKSGANIRK